MYLKLLKNDFKTYAEQVVENARALADILTERHINLVSGGTASHLILIDLRDKGLTGVDVCDALASAHIICNKNSVPKDTQKPSITSGLRIGTPAGTTRGFGVDEFRKIGHLIADIIDSMNKSEKEQVILSVREQVADLCRAFPIYNEGI